MLRAPNDYLIVLDLIRRCARTELDGGHGP